MEIKIGVIQGRNLAIIKLCEDLENKLNFELPDYQNILTIKTEAFNRNIKMTDKRAFTILSRIKRKRSGYQIG